MNAITLSRLQEIISCAEKDCESNPTTENKNKLIVAKDELQIFLNMNKDNLKKSDICEKEIS